MTWIMTHTGVKFTPLEPKVSDVCLEDIAHALSNMCRFNGHCKKFYSVAQHSVLVAEYLIDELEDTPIVLCGLFHDAAEAYLPDLCRPIKPAWVEFARFEKQLLAIISRALKIPLIWNSAAHNSVIKMADNVLLATELRDLMFFVDPELPPPLEEKIVAWTPMYSKRKFLEMSRKYLDKGT